MANKIEIDGYPGEAPYSTLEKGDCFHLCDVKGNPKVWIKVGSMSVRLFDASLLQIPSDTLVTKIPKGTQISIFVGNGE